jgi:hypothetical protein
MLDNNQLQEMKKIGKRELEKKLKDGMIAWL